MSSNTIDYGIDLGTTNSTIAKLKGIEVQIFKNNEGFEFTPSAVYMDNKERIQVGRRAKEQLENDPENAYSEFKLQMGSSDVEFAFSRSKKTMTPIELSAEILKSLKADVKLQTGEDLTSAVITVPAGFELPQCKATQAAAEMAGFTTCPLLMEPIAAAMAYGYQSTSDRVFWLVYDFGGGTFDAAIIQVRDGIIEVINHGGDNHLGGKLIDWEIVNGIFVPALVKKYSLEKFYHGNVKWRVAFAKLKAAAENAKIRLSREEDVEVNVEFKDEKNAIYELSLELSKSDLERIAQPFVSRSINICKKVIADKRLKTGDIEKVLLVGGTTLIPVLRELLSDPERGLGIPLESSHYPLTVVAEGAAIFAGTQQIKPMTDDRNNLEANEYMLELDYNSVGTDMEPLLGGKVIGNKEASLKDYSIEFINTVSRPEWRSGKIRINSESGFVTTLWAEKGKTNVFKIELTDLKGTVQITKPDSVSYTIGMTIDAPPLIHSIGVAMANNETDLFFEKGISLPSRKKQIHKTIHDIRPNQESDSIRIPVVEGENLKRASRNRLIGYLEISASNIKRTVPAGSEIEIVIEIDSSRMIKTKAYIPIIDEEFEEVIELSKQKISIDELKQDVKAE
ncbi:MAG: Hsp70 family protein, partial [Candidatus Cloacimonas sp.]|nr:Hsp70 family protein [Candidatus Cloacimonas sp.]